MHRGFYRAFTAVIIAALFAQLFPAGVAGAAEVRKIVFPVIGPVGFHNDFGAPRSGGRRHAGNDLMGRKMQRLVAAADGVISYVPHPEPSWGWAVFMRDADGYEYRYIHMNNDSPGTDNGRGGANWAYAPDVSRGMRVVRGQLLGWMGDSGNAEGTGAHLHFEIRRPDGTPLNPYQSLLAATRVGAPVHYPGAHDDEVLPYGRFPGGARVSLGNFDSDSNWEFVTGAGQGGGPHVRLFEQSGYLLGGFFPYAHGFRGGVDVAAGDVDGDGVDEIVTGAGPGGGPHVKVFKADGRPMSGFFAYSTRFTGGINVATGDVDGDGVDEIVVGPGPGGGPHVKVFSLSGKTLASFMAYDPAFRGGVDVAAADLVLQEIKIDGKLELLPSEEVVVGAGPGGGPHVRIFDSSGKVVGGFFAYPKSFRGGVRVDAADLRKWPVGAEIVTAPASWREPEFKVFDLEGKRRDLEHPFDEWWAGGYDVAAADGMSLASVGRSAYGPGRRASVRQGP
jgi:hypothetical protein